MMNKKLSIILLFFTIVSYSQQNNSNSFIYENEKLEKVLFDIEKAFNVKFSYLDNIICKKTISLEKIDSTLQQLVTHLCEVLNLKFKIIDNRYIAIYEKGKKFESFDDLEVIKEVVITAFLTKGINKKKDNSLILTPQKLGILPGLTEPDVLQALQRLPGVISPNETATGLHVRGGTTDQNLILWDDIPIYHNGHLFGMISGFNPNIDQTIQFYNKGTDPKYGGRLSSVIDIKTSDKIPNKTNFSLGVNALNTDVNIDMPLVDEKLKLQLSARRSFTELYGSYTFDKLSQKVFQNTKISENSNENVFHFKDYNAKVHYKISEDNTFTFSGILIDNDLDNLYRDNETNDSYNDKMKIANEGISGVWKMKWNKKLSHSINAFFSDYSFTYNYNKSFKNTDDGYEKFSKKNKILDSGFTVDMNYLFNDFMSLNTGYQYLAQDVSHAYTSKVPSLSFVLDSRADFAQTHSVYSSLNLTSNKFISINGGARLSYISNLNKFVVEPRFLLNYKVNDYLSTNLSGEVKNQVISQMKETVISDLSLENQLWVLSDMDRIPILKIKQYTVGATYKKKHWTFDLDTYIKRTNGITTLTHGFLNYLDPNLHVGESQSYGVDFYAKKDFQNIKTWLTYSFNSTQNKFEAINNYDYFPFNAEIKHNINTSISYNLNNWRFASGWYWNSGRPYTEIVYLDDQQQNPTIEKYNAKRLPNYHRMDISILKEFKLSRNKKKTGILGFSVYNIYNKKNILKREYRISNTLENEFQVKDYYSLQLMPNIFCKIRL